MNSNVEVRESRNQDNTYFDKEFLNAKKTYYHTLRA